MNIKKTLYYCIFILLFNSTMMLSQSIRIIDVDNTDYPNIAVTFESKYSERLDFDKLKLTENNQSCLFTVDNFVEHRQQKLNCFIVDKILFNNHQSRQVILKLLNSIIDKNSKNELINVVIAESDNQDEPVFRPISIEFTDNYTHLFEKCKHAEISTMPFKYISAKLFEYIKKYNNPDNNIIYISQNFAGNKIGKLLTAFSESLSVNYSKIQYLKEAGNEQNIFDELKKQIQSSGSVNSFANIGKTFNLYKINYRSNQNYKVNFFELHYGNDVVRGFFKDKNKGGITSRYTVVYKYLSVFLLLTCAVFIYLFIKGSKKKQSVKKYSSISKEVETNSNETKPSVDVELNEKTENFTLNKLRTTIGRGKDNDILIANLTVSNHHATITNEGGVFYIEDNDSTNGVKVNELKVSKQKIQTNDVIRLGKATLRLNY